MTRSEAAKICQSIKFLMDKEDYSEAVEEALDMAIGALEQEPTAEYSSDVISRQAAIEALNGLIDRFEQILRDIRETNVDDSVCGMCEYDGAYIGQSGDWCNECPGFDKDDCFKLSDECRKRWEKSVDLLSAQPFTAEQIQTMQELEFAQVEKAYELGKADRPKWIPCSERMPEEGDVVLICSKIGVIDFGKRKGDKWVWLAEALWDYWQETEDLIAWMPLPEAYREDGEEE